MINKSEILNSYNFRHACKEFNPSKKISDEDFNFILETGRLSPSSFGFEPWKFLVIQNSNLREKLRCISWGAQKQLPTCSHFVVILAKKEDMKYGSNYIEHIMKEIHHIPDDARKLRSSKYEDFQKNDFKLTESDRALFDWSCKQTYITLGNMMSSAAQIGIDSCAIEGFNREKVDQLLCDEDLINKEEYGVSIMVAFGYRINEPRTKTRQPIEDIVKWIK